MKRTAALLALLLSIAAGSLAAQPHEGPALPPAPWPVWTAEPVAVAVSATGITWYVDGAAGKDSHDGRSAATAFASIARAVQMVRAGDTVLIKAGLYREGIDLDKVPSGAEGRPITFGSYGDGEVVLDGSPPVRDWVRVRDTVWRAAIDFTPIAVVVQETPLKQVAQNVRNAPEGVADVTPGSGKWAFDTASRSIVADMGAAIGSRDPDGADVVVPKADGAQRHVYFYGSYYTFKGLTIRGSGSNGIWGYGSHITVERCNIKFNGKAGVSFQPEQGKVSSDNAVLYSHIFHNVLLNWPRGNNGFAESGGGWAGATVWSGNLRPLARGNVVHMNGGEGILSYGTQAGVPSGSALFEQNVVYDNWSVNMYFDNQPNDVARNNIIFNHPADTATWLKTGSAWPWNEMYKYAVCLMLADEQNSSDATGNYANLANTQVYNNLIAGCRIGIRDYAEGATAIKHHGLRNTLIANNTIVLPAKAPGGAIGLYLQDNETPGGANRNAGTLIQNNLVVGAEDGVLVWIAANERPAGVTFDHNFFHSPTPDTAFRMQGGKPRSARVEALREYATSLARRLLGAGNGKLSFKSWQELGLDAYSRFAEPRFVNASGLRPVSVIPYDYRSARLQSNSPALGIGTPQTTFRNNLADDIRHGWSAGAL